MRDRRRAVLARRRRRQSLGGLVITSFAQTVGSELLTNGTLATWNGSDNPSSWTVQGESGVDPMITEVAAGGGAGTGAARFYSSSAGVGIFQFGMTSTAFNLVEVDVSAYTSGTLGVYRNSGDTQPDTSASAGVKRFLRQHGSTSVDLWVYSAGACDLVVNAISSKAITPNPLYSLGVAGTFDVEITLPGTTYGGMSFYLLYRVSSLSGGNYWTAELRRNSADTAWDYYLKSWVGRVYTTQKSATGIGTPDALRMVLIGDTHQGYTREAGVWTARGTVTNSNLYAGSSDGTVVYDPGFTPTRLTA